MAISRERRTALAELMVATARMQTAKSALKDDADSDETVVALIRQVEASVERAMVALKS